MENIGISNSMTTTIDGRKLSRSGYDFIDEERLHGLLDQTASAAAVRDVIAKGLAKEPLETEETAVLLAAGEPELVEEIFEAARQLKRDVYGNRIVLFAPLYIGNECTNDCQYCAFRRSNRNAVRRTLATGEIHQQVEALENKGHKRLILVFGEHPHYTPEFMADCVREVYSVTTKRGEIRRANLNAAPLDHAGFATVKEADIGTYQIFQETYHHATYAKVHPGKTHKADYLWRLDGVARAMETGCDDVGIGALFGLYDWRFETLGLVSHARHLAEHYGVGPHTISFPPAAASQRRDAR
jgi:2-iminoacetate synthase